MFTESHALKLSLSLTATPLKLSHSLTATPLETITGTHLPPLPRLSRLLTVTLLKRVFMHRHALGIVKFTNSHAPETADTFTHSYAH